MIRPPVESGPLAEYGGTRALVLGGGGFIGQWVARALVLAGADTVVAGRDRVSASEALERRGIRPEVLESDLEIPGEIARLLRDVRPTVTFNLVGYGVDRSERDEARAWVVNRDLVRAVVEAASRFGQDRWVGPRVVHAGSALEYGTVRGDLREDGPATPTTLYGLSKLAGTMALAEAAKRTGLGAAVVRLFTVYGPGEQPGRLVPSLLEAASGDRPIPLTDGVQKRDFTYVEDVAEGMLRIGLAGSSPKGRVPIANLATGVLTSVREFVLAAAVEFGIPEARLEFGRLPTRPEEMAHGPVNTTVFTRLTGWAPTTTVPEGLSRTHVLTRGGGHG